MLGVLLFASKMEKQKMNELCSPFDWVKLVRNGNFRSFLASFRRGYKVNNWRIKNLNWKIIFILYIFHPLFANEALQTSQISLVYASLLSTTSIELLVLMWKETSAMRDELGWIHRFEPFHGEWKGLKSHSCYLNNESRFTWTAEQFLQRVASGNLFPV